MVHWRSFIFIGWIRKFIDLLHDFLIVYHVLSIITFLLFLLGVEVGVERETCDWEFFIQEGKVPIESRGVSLQLEAVFVKQHLKGFTVLGSLVIELEQLKEVTIVEILHEISFLSIRVWFCSTSPLSCFGCFYCLEIDTPFEDLTSVNFLFDTTNSDKTINNDVSFLADSAHTIHSLIVIGRVPIGIHDNYTVCAS